MLYTLLYLNLMLWRCWAYRSHLTPPAHDSGRSSEPLDLLEVLTDNILPVDTMRSCLQKAIQTDRWLIGLYKMWPNHSTEWWCQGCLADQSSSRAPCWRQDWSSAPIDDLVGTELKIIDRRGSCGKAMSWCHIVAQRGQWLCRLITCYIARRQQGLDCASAD